MHTIYALTQDPERLPFGVLGPLFDETCMLFGVLVLGEQSYMYKYSLAIIIISIVPTKDSCARTVQESA